MSALPPPYPKVGDVVWCKWPFKDADPPRWKTRPGLVLELDTNTAPPIIKLMYGTTQGVDHYGKGEFRVMEAAHLNASGLPDQTKFRASEIVNFRWDDIHFANAPGPNKTVKPTPIMGSLPPGLYPELQRALTEQGVLRPTGK